MVQLYVRDVESTVYRPAKELRAFAKVVLGPGESQKVTLRLDRRAFAVWDVVSHDWLVEAGEFELLVGSSSVDIRARRTLRVESDDVVSPAARSGWLCGYRRRVCGDARPRDPHAAAAVAIHA